MSIGECYQGPYFSEIYDAQYITIENRSFIYIEEEFIEGNSLRDLLTNGPLSRETIQHVGESLLQALIITNAEKLVHRDIKPGNIMIRVNGDVLLIDFGIARMLDERSVTSTYAIFGPMTIGYCAPEQIQNQKRQISIRTDFFALGVVLYQMATGENPFIQGATTEQEVITRCLRVYPATLEKQGFSKTFSRFVELCMSKQSHRRPPSPEQALALFRKIEWGA